MGIFKLTTKNTQKVPCMVLTWYVLHMSKDIPAKQLTRNAHANDVDAHVASTSSTSY